MKDAVIYSRVSTADQNFERQISDIKTRFLNEFNIINIFSEKQSAAIRSSERAALADEGML